MSRKEISAALTMALAGLMIVAILTLLLKGSVDWLLALVIALSYASISMLYWMWKKRS